jgi:hypothetical protein
MTFVRDAAGHDLVNLAQAMRISLRHHWRDDLWQVYAEFTHDKAVVLFEDADQATCRERLHEIERLLRDRNAFLY